MLFWGIFSKSLTHPEIDFLVQKTPMGVFSALKTTKTTPPAVFFWGGGVFSENSGTIHDRKGIILISKFQCSFSLVQSSILLKYANHTADVDVLCLTSSSWPLVLGPIGITAPLATSASSP